MENRKYVAVTVGPIFATINLSSSPAALWAGSFLFSDLVRTLCEILLESGVREEEIISPYFKKRDDLTEQDPPLFRQNGVGLFHDRIVFSAEHFELAGFPDVREKAVRAVADRFGIDADYLLRYVSAPAIAFSSDNPLADCAGPLDSLELAQPFMETDERLLLRLFEEKNVPGTAVFREQRDFPLKKGDGVRSIEDVVMPEVLPKNKKGDPIFYKRFRYYAILRSDGDNMGSIIRELSSEKARSFSADCMRYSARAADAANKYGGVTVYAGGDDLLAILPVEKNGGTVFDLIAELNGIFDETFGGYGKPTSLSYGVTIAYHKFPLFEALENSWELLETAKRTRTKNNVALRLQKHSGQSSALLIPNGELAEWNGLLREVLKSDVDSAESPAEEIFLSALHKVALFRAAFDLAKGDEVAHLFENTFDAKAHEGNIFLLERLPALLSSLQKPCGIRLLGEGGIIDASPSEALTAALRVVKFFVEKGEEE